MEMTGNDPDRFTVKAAREPSAISPGGSYAATIVAGQGIEAKYALVNTARAGLKYVRFEMTIRDNTERMKHGIAIMMEMESLLSQFDSSASEEMKRTGKGSYVLVLEGARIDFETDGEVLQSVVIRVED